jgi:hypothetical protein
VNNNRSKKFWGGSGLQEASRRWKLEANTMGY